MERWKYILKVYTYKLIKNNLAYAIPVKQIVSSCFVHIIIFLWVANDSYLSNLWSHIICFETSLCFMVSTFLATINGHTGLGPLEKDFLSISFFIFLKKFIHLPTRWLLFVLFRQREREGCFWVSLFFIFFFFYCWFSYLTKLWRTRGKFFFLYIFLDCIFDYIQRQINSSDSTKIISKYANRSVFCLLLLLVLTSIWEWFDLLLMRHLNLVLPLLVIGTFNLVVLSLLWK